MKASASSHASALGLRENKDSLWALVLFLMTAGVALRAYQYLFNRSLWVDEAMLALNIVDRTFTGLMEPLNFNQGAPTGFLFLEKFSTLALGNNEFALRIFPFVFSLISIILFWMLANKLLPKKEALLALVFFVFNQYLIYYSSEVKQYSGDVFFVLLLYLLFIPRIESELSKKESIAAAAIGAAIIWFSHPTVFVLAGFGLTKALYDIFNRKWRNVQKLAVIGTTWLSSGLLFYFISLQNLANEESLLGFWKRYFAPINFLELSTYKWYLKRLLDIMDNPIGLGFGHLLAAIILLTGLTALFFKDRIKTVFMLSPFLFLVIASSLRLYPLGERLMLFTVPILILFLTHGVFCLIEQESLIVKSAGIAIASFLCIGIAYPSVDLTLNAGREEIKPAITFLKENVKAGDVVFIPSTSIPAFLFYQKTRSEYQGINTIVCRSPRKSKKEALSCLQKLNRYTNVWFLLAHYDKYERRFFMEHLSDIGIKIDQFIGTGVEIHRFKTRSPQQINN